MLTIFVFLIMTFCNSARRLINAWPIIIHLNNLALYTPINIQLINLNNMQISIGSAKLTHAIRSSQLKINALWVILESLTMILKSFKLSLSLLWLITSVQRLVVSYTQFDKLARYCVRHARFWWSQVRLIAWESTCASRAACELVCGRTLTFRRLHTDFREICAACVSRASTTQWRHYLASGMIKW